MGILPRLPPPLYQVVNITPKSTPNLPHLTPKVEERHFINGKIKSTLQLAELQI
ncbi:hypothetical protein [Xanthocytophaga flava]|uniref:hypothetical protein n=1 Tax=Xanthocytophaga flava TaxID=3048013 RepID=UPI0028D46D74|nr:hypothetical protein [Xanthocytophaga flavus]